jgi:hypothetical protein
MRYKTINGKDWQQDDNKCHFGLPGFAKNLLMALLLNTYDNIGLAQKLQYF